MFLHTCIVAWVGGAWATLLRNANETSHRNGLLSDVRRHLAAPKHSSARADGMTQNTSQ